ncbi:MAG: NUDIX domain-containing protein [Cellulomonadaceae bacterium]|jgi:8-oxo-dGTP pyrophosphatase MutT (NUDIX family)|nr:NUDIX domain-containing protein [Cellulomonadaceae bacterium]
MTTSAPSTSYGALGADWVMGADGLRERSAARVLVISCDDSVLLVRGHDADLPSRSWWFSVGGGIDPGETPRQAASRELHEETGLVCPPEDLEGPVLTRTALFHFYTETCRQHETFFVARAPLGWEPERSGWTDQENNLLDELAWFTVEALRAEQREVFPHDLPDILDALAAGWDGTTIHLGTENDDEGLRLRNSGAE